MNASRAEDDKLLPVSASEIKSSVKAYKKGGLIDETGYIKVHGTEEEPEGILSSSDTSAMQEFWERINTN